MTCSDFMDTLDNKDITVSKIHYLTESITFFSHKVTEEAMEDLVKKYPNATGIEGASANVFFTTKQTLEFMTIDRIVDQCKANPDSYLEGIGRAFWLAMERTIEKYPGINWREISKKSILEQ